MGMKSHLFHNIKCTQSICTPVITQYKYTLSIAFWVKYARPCNKRGSVRLCKARKRCEVIHCPPFIASGGESCALSLWPCVPQGHAPRGHAPRGHAPRGHAPRHAVYLPTIHLVRHAPMAMHHEDMHHIPPRACPRVERRGVEAYGFSRSG